MALGAEVSMWQGWGCSNLLKILYLCNLQSLFLVAGGSENRTAEMAEGAQKRVIKRENMNWIAIVATLLGAYLLGSIPSAVWIGKIFYGVDVRTQGSGNAGTTNVLRVLGAKAALPVFAIDILKGYAAVSLVGLSGLESESPAWLYLKMALCAAVVVGHMYPIFAGFRGGKGVATLVGCMFAFSTGGILLALATFLVIVSATHYVSVGSMVGGLLLPFYSALCGDGDWRLMIFMACVSLLLFYTHRTNIGRLLHGTENKTYLFGCSKGEGRK